MADNRIIGGGLADDQRPDLRQRRGGDQRPGAVAAGFFPPVISNTAPLPARIVSR
jgi:hypothetical protein